VSQHLDLTGEADAGRFLEGTGSMVLDQQAAIAYAVVSKRTDPTLFNPFCHNLGYQAVLFDASDEAGQPVY
ncbi:arginine deiminase-related protein, partial [Flavobacterium sp. LMO9]